MFRPDCSPRYISYLHLETNALAMLPSADYDVSCLSVRFIDAILQELVITGDATLDMEQDLATNQKRNPNEVYGKPITLVENYKIYKDIVIGCGPNGKTSGIKI